MMIKSSVRFFSFVALLLLGSCKIYKQDIMFKLDDQFSESELAIAVKLAEDNYRIREDDLLRLEILTNNGERIIDPNFELRRTAGVQNMQQTNQVQYLVRQDGMVKLPMVGDVALAGLTIYEAEQKLQGLYAVHYKEPYAVLTFQNKRVIVLGANGGQVIPLTNENTSLIEIVAMSGGIGQGAKSQNVKLIRGNLNTPEIYKIDLSTVSGMRTSIVRVEPGDIIYIEPWRRVWLESLRDLSPILSLVSSVITLALVIQNINSN